jgi:hypothetical protein
MHIIKEKVFTEYPSFESQYDEAAKHIMSFKPILASLLKFCIDDYKDLSIHEISNQYLIHQLSYPLHPNEKLFSLDNETLFTNEGRATFDLLFQGYLKNKERCYFNIELQKDKVNYPLVKRGIYYTGRILSKQYNTEFKNQEYNKLKKVYSIWIQMNPNKGYENTVVRYHMKKDSVIGYFNEKKDYELIEVIIINLGNENDKNSIGVLRLLNTIFRSYKTPKEKAQLLKDEFGIILDERNMKIMETLYTIKDYWTDYGRKDGKTQTTINDIKIIMRKLHYSLKQAMDLLDIPSNEQELYEYMIHKDK